MWGAECDKAQETWYDRRRRHELDEANVQTDMWYNVCREQPPSIGDPKKIQIDFGLCWANDRVHGRGDGFVSPDCASAGYRRLCLQQD